MGILMPPPWASRFPFVDVTGDHTLSNTDQGKVIRFIGEDEHILTLPADLIPRTLVRVIRAPGCGAVSISGLTSGGISHPYDHASIAEGGEVIAELQPGIEGVNDGAPYWRLVGQTEP